MRTVDAAGLALAVSLMLIWPLRWIALKLGIMDRPGFHKSHKAAVPYLGGLAILGGVTAGILLYNPRLWAIPLLFAFVAAMGLVDDIRYLPVWAKLLTEAAVAIAAVASGFSWHITPSVPLDDAFSVLWMVGLTNSFNLLDNMDGLASTAAAGALIAFAVLTPAAAGLALPLAGASLGFLVINRPPARMYMGDAGSLMLGFGVALVSIAAANRALGLHSFVILAFPVAVAVLDTSLVIVSRLAAGRPVQLGGQDHFSHRLRLLGWTRPQILAAVAVASAGGLVGGALALAYPHAEAWLAVPIGVAFVGAWVGLLQIDPYAEANRPRLEVYVEQLGP